MIPVYLTTAARSDVRIALAAATIAAWSHHEEAGDVRLRVIDAGADGRLWGFLVRLQVPWEVVRTIPRLGSQRQRHIVARDLQAAEGAEWGIITDDDILPPQHGRLWLERALGALAAPTVIPWGLVSAWLPEAAPRGWPPPHARRPIATQGAVGGLRFVRHRALAGELSPWAPTPTRRGFDPQLCDHVRRRGYEVGIFTDPGVRATHAGQDWSSVHPGELAPGQPRPE